MMATTELHKIPDTILSRSQVFEFRSISAKAIAEQLRRIADAENISVPDAALAIVARAAEGSMRDAQSALDQVIAFAGHTIAVEDVSAVLGLIGRDLLFDMAEAVRDEDGPRAFALTDRAVESGHDLRLVCRELAGLVRDLMIVSVDPARASEGEIAEAERPRLTALAKRFSREDLMRAFDVLAKAEQDIRNASQPRYHLEMALLRWMHLQKLVPLTDLLSQLGSGGAGRGIAPPPSPGGDKPRPTVSTAAASGGAQRARSSAAPQESRATIPADKPRPATGARAEAPSSAERATVAPSGLKDALLGEIRASRGFFYNTVVAQAQRIEVSPERIVFTFLPKHQALRAQFEQQRGWLEAAAERLSGKKIPVVAAQSSSDEPPPTQAVGAGAAGSVPEKGPQGSVTSSAGGSDPKQEAMASPAVRDLLDVFPAEIRTVEEL
jgi:DNA polymerase-3 subunit gamma/tau